jgi:hypothetical protein
MKKLTAVEWLVNQLTPSIALQQKYIDELKEQAKELEKEQIVDALHYFGIENAKDYYDKTFNQVES